MKNLINIFNKKYSPRLRSNRLERIVSLQKGGSNRKMFYTGQKVICIDDRKTKNGLPISVVKGMVYSIKNIRECACGRMQLNVCDITFDTNVVAHKQQP